MHKVCFALFPFAAQRVHLYTQMLKYTSFPRATWEREKFDEGVYFHYQAVLHFMSF